MKIRSGILVLAFWLSAGCMQGQTGDEGNVSTDLVTNPLTASGVNNKEKKAVIAFSNREYDFGRIIQGEKISHAFTFTNDGDASLVISSVAASCGCTVPSWPKDPVKPGEGGQIGIVFDSEGKRGAQTKDITVVTNSIPNTSVLRITGEVIVP